MPFQAAGPPAFVRNLFFWAGVLRLEKKFALPQLTMARPVVLLSVSTALFFLIAPASGGSACSDHNNCNGHGTCNTKTCACVDGWGSATDVSLYKQPDCKARTFPGNTSSGTSQSFPLSRCPEPPCSVVFVLRVRVRVLTTPRTPRTPRAPQPTTPRRTVDG
jgi:hypothetical protein